MGSSSSLLPLSLELLSLLSSYVAGGGGGGWGGFGRASVAGGASLSYGQMSRIPTGGVMTVLVFVERPGKEVSSKMTSHEIMVVFRTGL